MPISEKTELLWIVCKTVTYKVYQKLFEIQPANNLNQIQGSINYYFIKESIIWL